MAERETVTVVLANKDIQPLTHTEREADSY